MRRSGFSLLVLLLALAVGAQAEEFRLAGAEGGSLTQESLAKGDTILVVWASWSPRCRDLPDRMHELQRAWGSKARIVTVNFQEDERTVRDALRSKPLGVPTYLDLDGRFSKSHTVTTLPGLLVFRDGRRLHRGALGGDADRILRRLLGS